MSLGAVSRNAIRARQHCRGKIGNRCRVGAHIGALIVENLILDRKDVSFAIDGGADVMKLLARMIGGDEVLAAILDPLYRPLHAQGGGADQYVLRIELAADPEAAADMSLVKVH